MSSVRLPIGVDNFAELVDPDNRYLYVDKSLLIKELIDRRDKILLIIRPRRWGKTLNMSMLQHFFTEQVAQKKTAGLFDGLSIGQAGDHYMQHQGQYPVIFISFKDIKEPSFENAYEKIYEAIRSLYDEHQNVLQYQDLLSPLQMERYKAIVQGKAQISQVENSLKVLCELLYACYQKPVYLLIDEYDTPLNQAYLEGYFKPMVGFLRSLFGAALKGNNALQQGVITGVLRLAKENLFSGLNNLKVNTLLKDGYSQYYGFTEEETLDLFARKGLNTSIDAVKHWYNGYQCKDRVIYNPWSIINCLDNQGEFRPYWVNTADNSFIRKLLLEAHPFVQPQISQLMQGKAIESSVDEYIVFEQLQKQQTALWSLFLFAGYLTTQRVRIDPNTGIYQCELVIPNQEIMTLYNRYFNEQLRETLGNSYHVFLSHLLQGELDAFERDLNRYLSHTVSFYDISQYPEAFYHGLVLGLIASLRETHHVYSNRESGQGRYDVLLLPKPDSGYSLGIILEFKYTNDATQLKQMAEQALQQIDNKHYHTELTAHAHVKQILQVGLAFSSKTVVCVANRVDE